VKRRCQPCLKTRTFETGVRGGKTSPARTWIINNAWQSYCFKQYNLCLQIPPPCTTTAQHAAHSQPLYFRHTPSQIPGAPMCRLCNFKSSCYFRVDLWHFCYAEEDTYMSWGGGCMQLQKFLLFEGGPMALVLFAEGSEDLVLVFFR